MGSLPSHLEERIAYEPNTGCWLWYGATSSHGYGNAKIDGGRTTAHRIIYELLKGPIPAGFSLDHLCRVRCCVNPDHLEPVTTQENTRRGVGFAAINSKKTHCDFGHPLDGIRIHNGRPERFCYTCRRQQKRAIRRPYSRKVTPHEKSGPVRLLSFEQILEARMLWATGGVTQRALAQQYGVSAPTMNKVLRSAAWEEKHQR